MSGQGLLRRNARLRKEYLYRKSLEGKEKELYEKKRKIRQALEGALNGPRQRPWHTDAHMQDCDAGYGRCSAP